MIKKVGEVRSQTKWNEATNMSSLAGIELPYIETMSDMIDGTEAIDWVRLLTPQILAALTSGIVNVGPVFPEYGVRHRMIASKKLNQAPCRS
jgi:hypothetical protein